MSEKKLVFLLAAMQFTLTVDFMLLMPLGPNLMRLFQITPTQFGFLVTAYAVAAGISGLFGALWLDIWNLRRSSLVLFVGFLMGVLLSAFAPTYFWLLAARFLTGSFAGMLSACIQSMIGEGVAPERRGRATGSVMSAFSIASVVGVPLGLWLASHFNWHAPFRFLGCIGLLVLILLLVSLPFFPKAKGKRTSIKDLGQIILFPKHLRNFALTITVMLSGFLVIPFLSPYLVLNVGLKESQLPLVYLVGGALNFFFQRWVGKWTDQWGAVKMFTIGASVALIPILMITHMPPLKPVIVIVLTTFFMLAVSARMVPAMTFINLNAEPKWRASFMSLNASVMQAGSGLAASIASFLISNNTHGALVGYNYVGYLSVFISLIAIRVLYWKI